MRCLLLVVLFLTNAWYPHWLRGEDRVGFENGWQESALGAGRTWFELNGTGGRNNPMRRKLAKPIEAGELFVRFQLRYAAESIDTPQDGNGEFFVLWLDARDGGDTATHSGGVPNVGVHVNGNRNAFMARFDSSQQAFGETHFTGDQEFTVVARLASSTPGGPAGFDELSVWIDPTVTELAQPEITISSTKRLPAVRWIGFSTGGKTEASDRIAVSDVVLSKSWASVLGLPVLEALSDQEWAEQFATTARMGEPTVDFGSEVLPLLEQHCFACHAGPQPESGLRLDSYDELLNQLTPRDSAKSHLVDLIEPSSDRQAPHMPPEDSGQRCLTDAEIGLIRNWIDEGAHWDHELLPDPVPQSTHWAYQPLAAADVPHPRPSSWIRTPVDAFIAQRHRQLGLTPSPVADWPTLRRRVALDLTGLPPSQFPQLSAVSSHKELDAALASLLDSTAYGERWGRHWLDLARWSESNGYQHNRYRPHAWRYRDYVIRAFQNDLPFDQFVREQLAGDLLTTQQTNGDLADEQSDALVATGFLAAARYSGNELDKEIQRNDILVDVVNTTAKAFLGVTLECAQCHTHKFDPFTIRDYYRFQAFFTDGQPGNVLLHPRDETLQQVVRTRWSLFGAVEQRLVERKRAAGHPDPILVTPTSVVAGMAAAERKALNELDAALAALPSSWGWVGAESKLVVAPHEMRWPLPWNTRALRGKPTYLRLRGDVKSVGPEVQPGWPLVFGNAQKSVLDRRDLAEWLVSPSNPLTARVWVNRIWQWHFGRGLVESSGDFGTQGSSPTHPQLLDWLAGELVRSGWSTRHIHMLILRSNTYRQSAVNLESNAAVDPENLGWWRWQPRRLEAEAIRDSALAVAGVLDREVGGPSVRTDESLTTTRRSVYLRQERQRTPEALALFDVPAAVTACSRRKTSTVATQPLFLLNSPEMLQLSEQFAGRVREQASGDHEYGSVALEMALGRKPDAEETKMLDTFLATNSLELLCQSLLNLNEFVYLQ